MGAKLDQTLAVLNGLVGDYLSRTDNALATEMSCWLGGRALALEPGSLARAYPQASSRVVVLLHGVMCTERVWTLEDGSDYGSLLARDLGFTPVYVRYNSGRAIADNGAQLASLLDGLTRAWPVPIEQLLPLGYSMGGLVLRSACHFAGLHRHAWLGLVKRAIYIGTPHLGAPAERAGRTVAKILRAIDDPYTRLISDIGDLRSAGVKDLGDAVLAHAERGDDTHMAPDVPEALRDVRHPIPLLSTIRHYLIAGSVSADPRLALLFGDAIVPIASATSGALARVASELIPKERVAVLPGLSHLALPRHASVYAQIKRFYEEDAA